MLIKADVLYSNLLADLSEVIDVALPSWSIDSTVREVACYSLRDSFLKKYNEEDNPSDEACRAALDKFSAVNKRCASWMPMLNTTFDDELLGEIKKVIYEFWFVGGVSPLVSDYRELYYHGRAGPGASLSARDTDFYTKMFDSPLSSTEGLPSIWDSCVSMTDLHWEAEASRSYRHATVIVDASRYSFVNKTRTVARGICTEPTINMWFQLGMGRVLEERLKSFFRIGLSTQPDRNRELAQAGSVNGNLSTIDLESASDSLGLPMLEYMLPRSFLAMLKGIRCPKTILPNGSELTLNMVSTMGNGFTFPLQTMLFAAVVRGVANWYGVRLHSKNFGVFGDDIICPRKITHTVERVLSLLGFSVNTSKTYVEGPFRESCGTDYYLGINVRGVYIKKLHSQQDLCVAINTLNRWSAKTGVILNRTVTLLVSGLKRLLYVPLDESDDAGIQTPFYYVPKKTSASRKKKSVNSAGRASYLCWTPREYAFYILGGHVWTYREQVRRNYNPAGLYISLLCGGIRGDRVLLRQRRLRYNTRRRVTPRWDYLPPRPLEGLCGPHGYRLFVEAWHWNLLGSSALM
ncbi:TPA_asm: RNA-directed RNA polymerase, partial [ssRNA phage Zoerhiza.4_7]